MELEFSQLRQSVAKGARPFLPFLIWFTPHEYIGTYSIIPVTHWNKRLLMSTKTHFLSLLGIQLDLIKRYIYLFIFGFGGSLLLHGLFSDCRDWGCPLLVVCGLLIAVGSLPWSTALRHTGFSSCGTWAH